MSCAKMSLPLRAITAIAINAANYAAIAIDAAIAIANAANYGEESCRHRHQCRHAIVAASYAAISNGGKFI